MKMRQAIVAMVLVSGSALAAKQSAVGFVAPECVAPQPALIWVDVRDARPFGELMRALLADRVPHRWLSMGPRPVLEVVADGDSLEDLAGSPAVIRVQSMRPPYCDGRSDAAGPILGGKMDAERKKADNPPVPTRVRVVVTFDMNGQSVESAGGLQRLRSLQDALLAKLAAYSPSQVTRFRLIPQMALEIDAGGKAAAEKVPGVESVLEDEMSSPLGSGPGFGPSEPR